MPAENASVYERISNDYYALTASEKKVADFVMAHQQETQFLSISELAENCEVAEATVSRFCRRLGYKGYNLFKLAVANASTQHKPWNNPLSGQVQETDSLDDISKKVYGAEVEALNQTMELLNMKAVKAAADLLESASRVLCMGQGGSMLIASEAAHLFSTVCNKFVAVADSHLQAMAAASADAKDVILFFSYSGSTKAMMQTLKHAEKRGVRVILVTRFPNAPGTDFADVVLQCGSNQNPLQAGSIPARIAQLYLLDVLFSELTRRHIPECREFRARIADALAYEHL